MPKITPCLWFNGNADEAVNHYCAIFKNSKVLSITHYLEGMPLPVGTLLVAMLELDGQEIMILNGGADFQFIEALSLYIDCETQDEVDWFWSQLSAGGEESQCGWLKDKFGVSWQVVPSILDKLLYDPDPLKAQRVTHAMLQMQKIDIAALQRAYDGE
jgi:predicted 3-demethylubiquinone-9 3-methyltransferase (glyoxalase superfamily)